MKKSKIKFIKQEQSWSSKDGKDFNKVTVTFENGDAYGFSTPAPSQFNYAIGDNLNYEITSEKYKSAKALGKAEFSYNKPTAVRSTNDSILRQVAFKGAIALASKGIINLNEIEEHTNLFNKLIK